MILFLNIDPLFENLMDHSEFNKILREIEDKFWKSHNDIKTTLKEKALL